MRSAWHADCSTGTASSGSGAITKTFLEEGEIAMAEIHYGDTVRLRSATDGSYLCYKREEEAKLIATSETASYGTKFILYNYHWDEAGAIPYAGSKKAGSKKSTGNFRLACVDVQGDNIVSPKTGKDLDDPKYHALHAHTDRDGADDRETFFFVNSNDMESTATIQYGDPVNIYNYSLDHTFVRHNLDSYVQCLDEWSALTKDTFIIEQVSEINV
jgi:hypothetical protein